jgi:hypothetical protein
VAHVGSCDEIAALTQFAGICIAAAIAAVWSGVAGVDADVPAARLHARPIERMPTLIRGPMRASLVH